MFSSFLLINHLSVPIYFGKPLNYWRCHLDWTFHSTFYIILFLFKKFSSYVIVLVTKALAMVRWCCQMPQKPKFKIIGGNYRWFATTFCHPSAPLLTSPRDIINFEIFECIFHLWSNYYNHCTKFSNMLTPYCLYLRNPIWGKEKTNLINLLSDQLKVLGPYNLEVNIKSNLKIIKLVEWFCYLQRYTIINSQHKSLNGKPNMIQLAKHKKTHFDFLSWKSKSLHFYCQNWYHTHKTIAQFVNTIGNKLYKT